MRYLCVHCDVRFEHEGDDKPRCPECMRVHGLEKLAEPSKQSASPLRRRALWASVAAGLLLIGGGYAWWAAQQPPEVSGDPPQRPLSPALLGAYIDEAGVKDVGGLDALLEADDAIRSFAQKAVADASGPIEKARAVVEALRSRGDKGAFVSWPLMQPRDEPSLQVAADVMSRLNEGEGGLRLYPLEVASLATSALRSVEVDAMVAEAWKFPGAKTPPDPSGKIGYYVVAVWSGEAGKGEPQLFDPYGGRSKTPSDDGHRVLTDVEAVGAALHHRALHALVNEADSSKALELSGTALDLAPDSPVARTVRGTALLQSGGVDKGRQELESALQLRSDAPRHKILAELFFAQRKVDQASREISKALELEPNYADAHAMLAAVHLRSGENALAKKELEKAESLMPELPKLPRLWAQYYVRSGDTERAVSKAREAIKRRPHDWQTRLHAGQIFRAGGYYDDMRRQARQILELVPDSRKARLRKLVERVLGPTAFDQPASMDGGTGGDLALSPGGGDLQLDPGASGGPSLMGGGAQGSGSSPSLLDNQDSKLLGGDKGASPLSPGGSGSKLKLRDPGDLELDLNE